MADKVPFELDNVNDWLDKKDLCSDGKIWLSVNLPSIIQLAKDKGRNFTFAELLRIFLDNDKYTWAEWYTINRMVDPDCIKLFAEYLISKIPSNLNEDIETANLYLKTKEGTYLTSKLWNLVLKSNVKNNSNVNLTDLKIELVEFAISMIKDRD